MMVCQSGRFGASATDPFFSSTKLLLGFEGADGSTTFTDQSASARGNASIVGNVQVDTAQSKFGGGSGLFDGTGDGIFYSDSADFHFGAGSYTVESFIRPANVAAGVSIVVGQWRVAPNLGWILYRNGAALGFNFSTTGSDNIALSGGTLVANTWHHVATDYDTSKFRLYLDGVMVASDTTPRTLFNSTYPLTIGILDNFVDFPYNGWIDELRITKGVARYASDSGFTVPAAAYPRS